MTRRRVIDGLVAPTWPREHRRTSPHLSRRPIMRRATRSTVLAVLAVLALSAAAAQARPSIDVGHAAAGAQQPADVSAPAVRADMTPGQLHRIDGAPAA